MVDKSIHPAEPTVTLLARIASSTNNRPTPKTALQIIRMDTNEEEQDSHPNCRCNSEVSFLHRSEGAKHSDLDSLVLSEERY